MAVSITYVLPIICTGHLGLKVGRVRFDHGIHARFRVICRDPAAVRLVDGPCPAREYECAVEAWLTRHVKAAA